MSQTLIDQIKVERENRIAKGRCAELTYRILLFGFCLAITILDLIFVVSITLKGANLLLLIAVPLCLALEGAWLVYLMVRTRGGMVVGLNAIILLLLFACNFVPYVFASIVTMGIISLRMWIIVVVRLLAFAVPTAFFVKVTVIRIRGWGKKWAINAFVCVTLVLVAVLASVPQLLIEENNTAWRDWAFPRNIKYEEVLVDGEKALTVQSLYSGLSQSIVIPESFNGLRVAQISPHAFGSSISNSLVKELHIPHTVLSIGDGAFAGLKGLQQLVLHGDEEKTLGDSLFAHNNVAIVLSSSNNGLVDIYLKRTQNMQYFQMFQPSVDEGNSFALFYSNGGSFVGATFGTDASLIPKAPTRQGYTFVSWCSDSSYTNAVAVSNAHTHYYAKWRLATPTVSALETHNPVTFGTSITLEVEAWHSVVSQFTYQWERKVNTEFTAIAGQTSTTLTLANVADSGEYVCGVRAISHEVGVENSLTAYSTSATYTINPKAVELIWSEDDYTYNGQTQVITAHYTSITGAQVNCVISSNTFRNAGEYEVSAIVNGNYEASNATKIYTIKKAQAVINAQLEQTRVYAIALYDVVATLNHSETSLSYLNADTQEQLVAYQAGVYHVEVVAEETSNYLRGSLMVTLTIEKATQAIDVSNVERNYVYNGSVQTVSGATVASSVQTVMARNNTFTSVLEGNGMQVEFYVEETANHKANSEFVVISVLPKTVDAVWGNLEVTFNGTPQKPTAHYIDVLAQQVSLDTGNTQTNAGAYPVTVQSQDPNYTISSNSQSRSFVINRLALNEQNVQPIPPQEYSGDSLTPSITFILEGQPLLLVEGVDYTLSANEFVESGTHQITITFIGNYSGQATVTFEINEDEE